MSYRIDHLVVSASDLEQGCDAMEALLDVEFGPRGCHAEMATENRLVAMKRPDGESAYLEVIAPDHAVARPEFPRWFDLDNFGGPPRLTNWVVACPDLEEAWELAPADVGRIMSFRRGDFAWRMIVPETGILPFDNCFPALIEWHSERPGPKLPDPGLILRRLKITHPEPDALRAALAPFVSAMENVRIVQGLTPGMTAEIGTPSGEIWIA
ncbi:VOC family protein [Celeribacter neptunius]|uniref:Glyoxalase-like domain-containing protein n=1 Tax=Celeribacter neptunius TaxID=588602 RepID=A0A1I3IIV4_9RHOB|nr:VOC family protein [Celeribacter neptunius]SFI47876.1 Glyoxalase-like domain-containing protein [Celeribacter neptunius]